MTHPALDAVVNRGPAKRVHDFKKPSPGEPWFTAPLERFIEMIDPFVLGLRTLPDTQLLGERDELARICAGTDHHVAHRLVLRIFDAEKARRADPSLAFDDDLDAALSRLVRNTTDADRQLVREIGESIYAIGGREALDRAAARMIALPNRPKAGLRPSFLQRRWAGIGGKS